MMITPEWLKTQREALVAKQQQALAAFHQTSGAIALLDTIAAMEQPAMTEEALKKLLGTEKIEVEKVSRKA